MVHKLPFEDKLKKFFSEGFMSPYTVDVKARSYNEALKKGRAIFKKRDPKIDFRKEGVLVKKMDGMYEVWMEK